MIKLSPSSLSTLKDCPLCFWLAFNKKISPPGGIFPSLPSGMDLVLKKHFDAFREKGTIPEELKGTGAKLFNNMDLLKVWRSNFKGVRWTDKKGNELHGAVDDILEKNGKLIVLDFKTRGFPLKDDTHTHYQDQLDIYNFLLRKNGHETEDYAYLLFYVPKEVNEYGHILFDTSLVKVNTSVKNGEELFRAALRLLEGLMPSPIDECG